MITSYQESYKTVLRVGRFNNSTPRRLAKNRAVPLEYPVQSKSLWGNLQRVKSLTSETDYQLSGLMNALCGESTDISDFAVPDDNGATVYFSFSGDDVSERTVTTWVIVQDPNNVDVQYRSNDISIPVVDEGIYLDPDLSDFKYEFSDELPEKMQYYDGRTVQEELVGLQQVQSLHGAIAGLAESFQSNISMSLSDVSTILNSNPNLNPVSNNVLFNNIQATSNDGKVTSTSFLAIISKMFSDSNSGSRAYIDNRKLYSVQAILGLIVSISLTVLSLIFSAIGGILAGIAGLIMVVTSCFSSIWNSSTDYCEWDGEHDFYLDLPCISLTNSGRNWDNWSTPLSDMLGTIVYSQYGAISLYQIYGDDLNNDFSTNKNRASVNGYLDITVNPLKYLNYIIDAFDADSLWPTLSPSVSAAAFDHFYPGVWVRFAPDPIPLSLSLPDYVYDDMDTVQSIVNDPALLTARIRELLSLTIIHSHFPLFFSLSSDRPIFLSTALTTSFSLDAWVASVVDGLDLTDRSGNGFKIPVISFDSQGNPNLSSLYTGIGDICLLAALCKLNTFQSVDNNVQLSHRSTNNDIANIQAAIDSYNKYFGSDKYIIDSAIPDSQVTYQPTSLILDYSKTMRIWMADEDYEMHELSHSSTTYDVIFHDKLLSELAEPTISTKSSFCANVPNGGISIPSISTAQTRRLLLITAAIAATTALATTVVCRRLASRRVVSQTKSRNKLKLARDAYLADPSSSNAKAYAKQVRKYNFKAKIFGWGSYDAVNDWVNAPAGTNASSNGSGVLSSLPGVFGVGDDTSSGLTPVDLNPVIKIISGS